MKWKKDAKEGSLIVGGKFGDGEKELHNPTDIAFDQQIIIYILLIIAIIESKNSIYQIKFELII